MRYSKSKRSNDLTFSWNLLFNILLFIFSAICVLPILFVYILSFSSQESIVENGYKFIPETWSTFAYQFMFSANDQILTSYRVSIFVTIVGTVVGVFICSMFAYAISRKAFKYRYGLAFFVFFTMLFNGGLVPSYMVNTRLLHLQDTIWILILPMMVAGWNIIILRTFFATTIHDGIVESAKIDGANDFYIFCKIVLPLSKPGLATVGLFMVVGYWNDWFLGLMYITEPKLVSVQYMLMKIQNSIEFIKSNATISGSAEAQNMLDRMPTENGRMALVVIAMTPILFAYPFFQRYFIKGLTIGGIKE